MAVVKEVQGAVVWIDAYERGRIEPPIVGGGDGRSEEAGERCD